MASNRAQVFHTFGWSSDVRGLPALLDRLRRMGGAELAARERAVRALRESHFTLEGAMRQIGAFLMAAELGDARGEEGAAVAAPSSSDEGLGGGSDLECGPLPASIRGARGRRKQEPLCAR